MGEPRGALTSRYLAVSWTCCFPSLQSFKLMEGVMPVSITASCPKCGLPAADGQRSCSLCHAAIHPVNVRRVSLWLAVAVEYLVVVRVLVSA